MFSTELLVTMHEEVVELGNNALCYNHSFESQSKHYGSLQIAISKRRKSKQRSLESSFPTPEDSANSSRSVLVVGQSGPRLRNNG